jgi:hypothetical protein
MISSDASGSRAVKSQVRQGIPEIDRVCRLSGVVHVSGSTNATLPIMVASLLSYGESTPTNTPLLTDIRVLGDYGVCRCYCEAP